MSSPLFISFPRKRIKAKPFTLEEKEIESEARNQGETRREKLEFGLPRGMRDILPEEFESAEIIRSAFLDTSRLFDYKIMEPSPLELVETLEAKSGPSIRDEIYFFKDKS